MKRLLLAIFVLILVVGCGNVGEKKLPVLTLTSSKDVLVAWYGDNGVIEYTLENPNSDTDMQVENNSDWVRTTMSGGVFSYEVEENNSHSLRDATIILTYGSEHFNVKITQEAKPQAPPIGTHNGYEWVDLGFGVKWATCNIGADSPEDSGNYYAWGETKTKAFYGEDNCLTLGMDNGEREYFESYDVAYDAAQVNWGGNWRVPTRGELEDLRDEDNYIWTWTTQNGHDGYKVVSKKNGNSIFLPAAGFDSSSALDSGISRRGGHYWSSSLGYDTNTASALYFGGGPSYGPPYVSIHCHRDRGCSVRPVLYERHNTL